MRRNPPNGRTPLGASLREKVLKPLVIQKAHSNSLTKPVLVVILTDGAASRLSSSITVCGEVTR